MTTPVIDRRAFHFPEAVEANFGFLAGRGFKRVQGEETLVRFQSDRAYVNVYHGRKSFEVGLEIGPFQSVEAPYSMSEIIRLVEANKADEYRNYSARSTEGVAEGVRQLAALFHRYVDAGLLKDPKLFESLLVGRETWKQGFALEVNLTQVRRKLEAAWHSKDYAKVVELLKPLRDALTPTELQKLDYAEKHAGRLSRS
jgi:hypothetical protein